MVVRNYWRCGVSWFLNEAKAMRDYPTHLRMSDVSHPLLVIRGENDPIAKAQWCDWLLQQVREGNLATVPGARHGIVHSHPEATAAAILSFTTGGEAPPH